VSNNDKETIGRRTVISGLGAAALAGLAVGSAPASAQSSPKGFVAKRHALDAWMDGLTGDHRVFIDTSNAGGGANAIRYGNNFLDAQVDAYGGSEADMAIIVCYRHTSTPFAFNDAMWAQYAEGFALFTQERDASGAAPTKNRLYANIVTLGERGVHFAVCNKATTTLSGMLARNSDSTAEEIHAELTANAIPRSRFVPAGIMALTRAQEFGYSLLYSAS
jgi:intracellular sulfur oxidation DsrE/DsrF family protein